MENSYTYTGNTQKGLQYINVFSYSKERYTCTKDATYYMYNLPNMAVFPPRLG